VRSSCALLAIGALVCAASAASPSLAQVDVPPHPTLPECDPADPTLIKPDLVPETPSDVRTLNRSGYREMDFTTSVGNIGPGPLILEGLTISTADGVHTAAYQHINRTDGSQCAHSAGLFVYHPQHAHWHFDRFVGYELRRDDPYTGELVGGGEKMSFCLLDIQPVRGFNPLRYPRTVLTQTCHSAEGIYGISVGWEDVYEHFLPGQSINLDPDAAHQVPEGGYFLVIKVNPDGRIWEANTDNNTSFASVSVPIPPPVLAAAPPPTPTPGPAKNPQLPHLRPGRIRPTRVPRAPRVQPGAAATPTPTRTRPVESTSTPTSVPTAVPTAVPTSGTSRGPHQPHSPHTPGQPA
jgi:hypothetical protein